MALDSDNITSADWSWQLWEEFSFVIISSAHYLDFNTFSFKIDENEFRALFPDDEDPASNSDGLIL